MNIIYDDIRKDLPNDQLHELFVLANWSDGNEDEFLTTRFNYPFINSTFVISAWDNNKLVGAVRVLSDKTVRSVIQDLVVHPDYQNKGIGKELVRRCISHYPDSEWTVHTSESVVHFYKKLGFIQNDGVNLRIPSKYF